MEDLISIIIPIYNVAYYLETCLNSILRQTYSNLEIILVNDGSTDNSGRICDRYATKDSRIRVIHKENGGVSSARNMGLDTVRGKYVCFADGDDIMPCNSIMTLYTTLRKADAQFCQGTIKNILSFRDTIGNMIDVPAAEKGDDTWRDFIFSYNQGPYASLYDFSILQENRIRFPLGIEICEDAIFNAGYLLHCDRVCATRETVYYYNRGNEASATHKGQEEILRWTIQYLDEVCKLFSDDYRGRKNAIEEVAICCLDFVLTHYVVRCAYLGKQRIIELLENVYNNMRPYLNELSTADLRQELSREICDLYRDYLLAGEYSKVYDTILERNMRQKTGWRAIVRPYISKLKMWMVFQARMIRY